MIRYYALNADHTIRPVDMATWARSFEDFAKRRVAENTFGHEGIGEIRVSTVFLGIDHRFFGHGQPILFETMIFGGGENMDGWMRRACTWDEALAVHAHAVDLVKNAFNELAKASGA